MSIDSNAQGPITAGNVVANLWAEIGALCRELEERRRLAIDLEAWFAKNPGLSEKFGKFQRRKK